MIKSLQLNVVRRVGFCKGGEKRGQVGNQSRGNASLEGGSENKLQTQRLGKLDKGDLQTKQLGFRGKRAEKIKTMAEGERRPGRVDQQTTQRASQGT